MMYGLENYSLSWGQVAEFADAFDDTYESLMVERGARLVGAWQPTSLSRTWPGAQLLWEFDGPGHIQDVSLGLYRGSRPAIRDWEKRTAGIVTGATGRLLHPSANAPTLAELDHGAVNREVVVYEEIDTQPDRQVQYCEHIEDVWLPSDRPFPGGEMMEQDVFDTPGVRQWNRSASAARVGYDDGILVSLGAPAPN